LGDYILENNLSSRDARHVIRVFKENLKDHIAQFKRPAINNELECVSTNIGGMMDNDNDDNQSEILFRISKPLLKKSALGVRLSLRIMDEIIDDLDEDDLTFRNSQNVWITKEMLMQHRLRLHEQLDQLLRQSSKLKNLQKATTT